MGETGKKKNVHAGHRQRLKEQFLRDGLEHMEPHVVLELLLFYAIPQGNVNPLAHRLLERFGNLYGVCNAPFEELLAVEGVGHNTEVLLQMMLPLCRELQRQNSQDGERIINTEMAVQHLRPLFFGRKEEVVALLLLDSRGCRLYAGVLCVGSVRTVPVYIRDVVRLIIQYGADTAILAHNHPSGSAIPSQGDIKATEDVYRALDAIDCRFSDHLILAGENYVSLSSAGLMEIVTGQENPMQHSGLTAETEFVY